MASKVIAIVQARVGSTRLPGKVLKEINGKSLIEILFYRLSQSKKIDKIILATSTNDENDPLTDLIENLGNDVFRGSEDDVLGRYYNAAKKYNPETVVRITGDCPIVDPKLVDEIIYLYEKENADYVSNTNPPTYPDGLDVEVFSFDSLKEANKKAKTSHEREHVTPFIRANKNLNNINLSNDTDLSKERWTVDDPEDLSVIENILNHFAPNLDFSWWDVLELKQSHPEYFEANQHITRNKGSKMGTGQKLWKRAKKIIPGGNMLLSKRAEMFLPDHWPAYFSKAKGCKVWDLDGHEFIDMSIMGIGTNTLGYGHPEVDEAVRKVVDEGNMSTFNCPEEVYLAERLVELHPWADMVRFARTGGEANAIAIRIARAAAGKDKVAICGYHGWHDWYLAANLGDETTLDGHLLPGLEPKGVPRNLKDTTLVFKYNDLDSIQQLVREHDIGIIKMEVSRSVGPEKGFLESVYKLATENNIILIFDECTSGFRETFGGLHKKYGVEPDMALFGKTLGNGYAITAVVGKKEIMKSAQETFISSTFWTERIGSAAALKTLEVMEREKSWEQITATGRGIGKRWQALADKYQLPIEISGLPALVNFSIPVENWMKYKTLITQEMLKNGYLAANSVYVSTEHTEQVVDAYFEKFDPVFSTIADCENGRNVDELLEGPVCHAGFKRLN
ncbi:MAG: aminotransferase class III-fold pyridoxal phosphate-dependent enzyme [Bacteroidales bacterium]|nr:aminotransferase class III-fold pyridoxal phosphate-dependent enzyme [Bacteroidales bacterium]